MACALNRVALLCGVLAAAIASGVAAQGTPVYRYTDKEGRIIYSDKEPPPEATNVQSKRLGGNYIETDELPLAARQAQERFPVTLFTFPCGELCKNAEALLTRRGVPFTTVNVEDPKGAEQLKTLTGELNAPVLLVGDKMVTKGFNETRWNAMLDDAGYPKTATPRRAATAAARTEPPPAKAAAAPVAPVPGSGYPKQ
ncbi:MAG: glutaredoxin family protein [Betaproteobacteria bacterium]